MHLLTASALMGALWLFRMKKTPEVNKRLVNEVRNFWFVTSMSLWHTQQAHALSTHVC